MKYLFFDCECANCYDHEGKICSFGYVITDESFRLLEEKDIIINPNAPFDPHVLGQGTNSIDSRLHAPAVSDGGEIPLSLPNHRFFIDRP
jgi:hypothetical protein